MAIEHDGISCRIPPSPLSLAVAAAFIGGGVFALIAGYLAGAGLVLLGALGLLEQLGTRRVRVIHSKLLVEDSRMLSNLLIGPRRRRVGWEEVRGIQTSGGRFALETAGAPFVATTAADPAEVTALAEMVRRAMAAAEKRAADEA